MTRNAVIGQLGLFRPDSDWRPPSELPDLRGRPIVAIDTETRDDGLSANKGPGWALGPAGYLCGVAYAADGVKGYIPVAHPESENFPLDNVIRWVSDLFASGTRIVFHNGPYDIGWLGSYGVPDPVTIDDTSAAAVMLDETHRSYSLDACLAREGLPLKNKDLLNDAARAYGGDPAKAAAYLYLMPSKFVGPYAEDDAARTLDLWQRYEPQLKAQGVWDAYRLEMDLIPIVVAMRRRGIRVDLDRAEQVAAAMRLNVERLCDIATNRLVNRRRVTIQDLRSPQWLATAFSNEGLRFPRTAKTGQGSFSKEWMQKSEHWLPRLVVEARAYEDAASKFVDGFIMSFAHRGRLHAEVHQFLTDDGGTRSQRFSYSNPPLQQMPRVAEGPDDGPLAAGENPWEFFGGIGGAIRGLFLPERGEAWGAFDYSQQEPRITVHFAAATGCAGVEDALRRYNENPRTDYHRMVADMTGFPRPRAKILNLAMTYGRGARTTAEELGVSLDEGKRIIEEYHSRLPYIRPLEELCRNRANSRGYIRLIDGARMHYNEWDGGWLDNDVRADALMRGKRLEPCRIEEARQRASDPDHPWYGRKLRRADTRKALNNLVQGSAARQTKKAIVDVHRAGYLPLIQMHDEIGVSVSSGKQVREIHDIVRDAIPLRVPVVVDAEIGRTWGEAKYSWEEYEKKFL